MWRPLRWYWVPESPPISPWRNEFFDWTQDAWYFSIQTRNIPQKLGDLPGSLPPASAIGIWMGRGSSVRRGDENEVIGRELGENCKSDVCRHKHAHRESVTSCACQNTCVLGFPLSSFLDILIDFFTQRWEKLKKETRKNEKMRQTNNKIKSAVDHLEDQRQ